MLENTELFAQQRDYTAHNHDVSVVFSWILAEDSIRIEELLQHSKQFGNANILLSQVDENGLSPLAFALKEGLAPMVRLLLAHGALPILGHDGCTLLHRLVIEGNAVALKLLLNLGAKTEALDSEGRTALQLASELKAEECMLLLLKHGANSAVTYKDGQQLVHYAAARGDLMSLGLLSEFQANLDAIVSEDGRTALHIGIVHKQDQVVLMLLRRGAATNIRDKSGHAALHLAAITGVWDMIWHLIRSGADPAIINDDGLTASQIVQTSFPGISSFLRKLEMRLNGQKRVSPLTISLVSNAQQASKKNNHFYDLLKDLSSPSHKRGLYFSALAYEVSVNYGEEYPKYAHYLSLAEIAFREAILFSDDKISSAIEYANFLCNQQRYGEALIYLLYAIKGGKQLLVTESADRTEGMLAFSNLALGIGINRFRSVSKTHAPLPNLTYTEIDKLTLPYELQKEIDSHALITINPLVFARYLLVTVYRVLGLRKRALNAVEELSSLASYMEAVEERKLIKDNKDKLPLAFAYILLGHSECNLGLNEESVSNLAKGKSLLSELPNHAQVAKSQFKTLNILYNTYKLDTDLFTCTLNLLTKHITVDYFHRDLQELLGKLELPVSVKDIKEDIQATSIVLLETAWELHENGQVESALNQLNEALSLFEQFRAYMTREDATLLTRIVSVLYAMGQYEKALEYCRQSLALLTQEISHVHHPIEGVYSAMGKILFAMRHYNEAAEQFKLALVTCEEKQTPQRSLLATLGLTYSPTNNAAKVTSFLQDIANALFELAKYDEALKYYQRSHDRLMRNPLENTHDAVVSSLSNIGKTLNNLGRFAESLRCFEQALNELKKTNSNSIDQQDARVAICLAAIGTIHYSSGRFVESLVYYDRAIVIYNALGLKNEAYKATIAEGLFWKVVSYMALGRLPEAIEIAVKAWVLCPSAVHTRLLAQTNAFQASFAPTSPDVIQKTDQYFRLTISLGNDDLACAHVYYGGFLYLHGRPIDAIKEWCLALKSPEASVHTNLRFLAIGTVLAPIQQEICAQRLFRTSPALLAHFSLVIAYFELGKDVLAQQHLRLLELEVSTQERFYADYSLLGYAYKAAGQLLAARNAFAMAIDLFPRQLDQNGKEQEYRLAKKNLLGLTLMKTPPHIDKYTELQPLHLSLPSHTPIIAQTAAASLERLRADGLS